MFCHFRYKFVKVLHPNHERAKAFKVDFTQRINGLKDILFEWSPKNSEIIVSPERFPGFESILEDLSVDFEIAHHDVSRMVSEGGYFTHRSVVPLAKKGRMSSIHNIELDHWNSHENVTGGTFFS